VFSERCKFLNLHGQPDPRLCCLETIHSGTAFDCGLSGAKPLVLSAGGTGSKLERWNVIYGSLGQEEFVKQLVV
jgi:hypothetical protein